VNSKNEVLFLFYLRAYLIMLTAECADLIMWFNHFITFEFPSS